MKLDTELKSDTLIKDNYVKAGTIFGLEAYHLKYGDVEKYLKSVSFEQVLNNWVESEQEYARREYRTLGLETFISLGRFNVPITNLIGQKRSEEELIFHAKICQRMYQLGFQSLKDYVYDIINNNPELSELQKKAENPKPVLTNGIWSEDYSEFFDHHRMTMKSR